MVKRAKKRKGFTLIELIAVMSILAVLGAILVPKISGYKARAQKSNIQSSAKTLLNTIDAYNSDKEDADKVCMTVTEDNTWRSQVEKLCTGVGEESQILDINKIPVCLGGGTDAPKTEEVAIQGYTDLEKVANGEFTISKTNGLGTEIALSK